MRSNAAIIRIAAGLAAVLEAVGLLTLVVAFLSWRGTTLAMVLNFPSFWIVAYLPDLGVRITFLSGMFVMILIQFPFWFAVAYAGVRLYQRCRAHADAGTVPQ